MKNKIIKSIVALILIVNANITIGQAMQSTYNIKSGDLGINNIESVTNNKIIMNLDNSLVILRGKGDTKSINVQIIENDKIIENPIEEINFKSSDSSIAYESYGFIYAVGKGKAIITAEYKNIKKFIEISVESNINIDKLININNYKDNNIIEKSSLSSTQVAYTLKKARDMTQVTWKPSKDLYGWKTYNYFKSGNTYTGIPYTQSPNQVDDIAFKNSINKEDFYKPYNSSMCMYGNDCSGFVSAAFYINRHTTWSLISDPLITKLASLDDVQKGDAVVTNRKGIEHTFIIYSVSGDIFYCYEQTPMVALATKHTKSELRNKGYVGIRNYDWGGAVPNKIILEKNN